MQRLNEETSIANKERNEHASLTECGVQVSPLKTLFFVHGSLSSEGATDPLDQVSLARTR